jgi:hypothetical protein
MNSEPLRHFRRRIAVTALTGGFVGATVVAPFFGWSAALGLALGSATSALTFHQRSAAAERIVALGPESAERRVRGTSVARSLCRVAILAVAYARPEISFPWAAGGFFVVPVAILANRFGAQEPSP